MKLIPTTKFVFNGNKSAGQGFIKFANNQLSILKRQMSYQKLNEGRRVVSPFVGVNIECLSKFKHDEIRIFVSSFPKQSYQDRVTAEIEKLKRVEERLLSNAVLYFVRIRYGDLDTNPYSAPFPSNYESPTQTLFPLPAMDRLMVWELFFDETLSTLKDPSSATNRANGFVPGKSTLIADVDVESNTVYYPENLAIDKHDALVAAVIKNLEITPTRLLPQPNGSLEDLAKVLFVTGGISNPFDSAKICGTTAIPTLTDDYGSTEIFYLDSVFYLVDPADKQIGSLVPLNLWYDDWCPNYGGSLTYYNDNYTLNGFDEVSNKGPFYTSATEEFNKVYEVLGTQLFWPYYNYIHGLVNSIEATKGKTLVNGTFFTGSCEIDSTDLENNFKCFFILQCNFEGSARTSESYGWGHYTEGENVILAETHAGHYEYYSNNDSLEKIETPLEIITNIELSHHEYDLASCYERECAFDLPGDFYMHSYGYVIDNPSNPPYTTSTFEPQLGTRCMEEGDDMPTASGSTTEMSRSSQNLFQTKRDDFHIVQTSNAYFISLSHLHEARGSNDACMSTDYIDYGDTPIHPCNGVAGGFDTKPISEIGYLCYIFSPKSIMSQDPSNPDKTVYWDINEARRSQDIINPYRCLDIEEYVNSALGTMQRKLDNTPGIPTCDTNSPNINGLSAYPMREYGYGITDGFIKK